MENFRKKYVEGKTEVELIRTIDIIYSIFLINGFYSVFKQNGYVDCKAFNCVNDMYLYSDCLSGSIEGIVTESLSLISDNIDLTSRDNANIINKTLSIVYTGLTTDQNLNASKKKVIDTINSIIDSVQKDTMKLFEIKTRDIYKEVPNKVILSPSNICLYSGGEHSYLGIIVNIMYHTSEGTTFPVPSAIYNFITKGEE